MSDPADLPLDPPPRKAHLRRGVRNYRRAYRTVFALMVLVFGGWAALDASRWGDLADDGRYLTLGFAAAAVLAFIVWQLMDLPLARELRLARSGELAQGRIVTIAKPRGRRGLVKITYLFHAAGASVEGECDLPRRFPAHALEPDQPIDILFDPADPGLNRPVFALDHVEFGDPHKKKKPTT